MSGVRDIHENNSPRQQNLLALTSGIRDPRLGKRMANEASSSSMNQPPTPSSVIANLSHALRMKILIRILKLWQFKWIEVRLNWNYFFVIMLIFVFLFSNNMSSENLLHCLMKINIIHWRSHNCLVCQS
jgi:hypothetical protein